MLASPQTARAKKLKANPYLPVPRPGAANISDYLSGIMGPFRKYFVVFTRHDCGNPGLRPSRVVWSDDLARWFATRGLGGESKRRSNTVRNPMSTLCLHSLTETFTPEMIEEFGGPQELLMCLESLSQKLRDTQEDGLNAED